MATKPPTRWFLVLESPTSLWWYPRYLFWYPHLESYRMIFISQLWQGEAAELDLYLTWKRLGNTTGVYPMTDPYACHINGLHYHQDTPVMLASIYHTYGSYGYWSMFSGKKRTNSSLRISLTLWPTTSPSGGRLGGATGVLDLRNVGKQIEDTSGDGGDHFFCHQLVTILVGGLNPSEKY